LDDPQRGERVDNSGISKKTELLVFLFITIVLAPLLSVVLVGGYGFVIWVSQLLMGPPGSGG
jgi:nitrate reductase NapE